MSAPHLVILGARGQVGRELRTLAGDRGLSCRALSHSECDVANPDAVERAVLGANVVVNCAAFTDVDRAEIEMRTAFRTNTTGAGTVASVCARVGAALVQLSTSYVFDGLLGRPLREDDPVAPLNVYGRSMLAGEEAVRTQVACHIILRTSRVFAAHGSNFVRTVLRIADEGQVLRVTADQIGGPTAAADVAAAVLRMVEAIHEPDFDAWGTYHYCGAPAVSWYDFAHAILSDRPELTITPVAAHEFPAAASRPACAYLDCGRVGDVFGLPQPQWLPALRQVVTRLRQNPSLAAGGTAAGVRRTELLE